MVSEQIGSFFISYILFGACLINLAYVLSHIFDNPDTASKYMTLIFLLGFVMLPVAISMIFASFFGWEETIVDALSIWYFIDPIILFTAQLFLICCKGKPYLDDFEFEVFGIKPTTGLYCALMILQTLAIGLLNVLFDYYCRNKYRSRGGTIGEHPPMLEVRQDVLEHENEVRETSTDF